MAVDIRVENFGPVGGGEIRFSPLTVLVGANNTGKSYLAMLLHSVADASPAYVDLDLPGRHGHYARGREPELSFRSAQLVQEYPKSSFDMDFDYLHDTLSTNQRITASTLPPSLQQGLKRIISRLLTDYGINLRVVLEEAFNSDLPSLARRRRSGQRTRLSFTVHSTLGWSITVSSRLTSPRVDDSGLDSATLLRTLRRLYRDFFSAEWLDALPRDLFAREVMELLIGLVFRGFPYLSSYLPAGRSGLLEAYPAIATAAFSGTGTPQGARDLPGLRGVTADFFRDLLRTQASGYSLHDRTATYLEQRLLDGGISQGNGPAAPITYRLPGLSMPVQQASSMVAELAPVVLLLRYGIVRKHVMILEEPEAHLHPSSQRVLAHALARVVNADTTVVVTTHSDYFLEQLNNLIRASNLGEDDYEDQGITPEEVLASQKVRAYLVHTTAREAGNRIRRLRVTSRDGMPATEFSVVVDRLYNQRAVLDLRRNPNAK